MSACNTASPQPVNQGENRHMPDQIRDAVNQLHPNGRKAYLKNGNEIISGLERLDLQSMTPEKSFIYYYFACEWMAKLFYGISANKKLSDLKNDYSGFNISWIKQAQQNLNLSITLEELDTLFKRRTKSARDIRNKIAHKFTESTLQEIADRETEFIPIFKKLLKEWEAVSARLE